MDSHSQEQTESRGIKLLKKLNINTTSQMTGEKYENLKAIAKDRASSTQCAESTLVRPGVNPQQCSDQWSDQLLCLSSHSDNTVKLESSEMKMMEGGSEDQNVVFENPMMGRFFELLSINSPKPPGSSEKSRGVLMQRSDISSHKKQEKYKAGLCNNSGKPRGLSFSDPRWKSRRPLGTDLCSSSLSNSNAARSENIDHNSKLRIPVQKQIRRCRIPQINAPLTMPGAQEDIAERII